MPKRRTPSREPPTPLYKVLRHEMLGPCVRRDDLADDMTRSRGLVVVEHVWSGLAWEVEVGRLRRWRGVSGGRGEVVFGGVRIWARQRAATNQKGT